MSDSVTNVHGLASKFVESWDRLVIPPPRVQFMMLDIRVACVIHIHFRRDLETFVCALHALIVTRIAD